MLSRSLLVALPVAFLCTLALGDEDESSAPTAPPRTWRERLGSPARPEAVAEAVALARSGDAAVEALIARSLGQAGGRAAAEGVADLLDIGSPDAREVALRSVTQIGLRAQRLRTGVRRALEWPGAREREAAILALGTVGDARDVESLLELAGSGSRREKVAAFRALRAMTGARIPFVEVRWRYYCRQTEKHAAKSLPAAMEAIEAMPGGEDAARHRQTVLRYGWADIPFLSALIHEWLYGADMSLRAEACRLAAGLRLADLGPALHVTWTYAYSAELREVSANALDSLGVPMVETEEASPNEEN